MPIFPRNCASCLRNIFNFLTLFCESNKFTFAYFLLSPSLTEFCMQLANEFIALVELQQFRDQGLKCKLATSSSFEVETCSERQPTAPTPTRNRYEFHRKPSAISSRNWCVVFFFLVSGYVTVSELERLNAITH